MNGCAYCLDMHSKDARARGETEQRIYLLTAWGETPLFTDRERAALEWTEAAGSRAAALGSADVDRMLFDERRAHRHAEPGPFGRAEERGIGTPLAKELAQERHVRRIVRIESPLLENAEVG